MKKVHLIAYFYVILWDQHISICIIFSLGTKLISFKFKISKEKKKCFCLCQTFCSASIQRQKTLINYFQPFWFASCELVNQ